MGVSFYMSEVLTACLYCHQWTGFILKIVHFSCYNVCVLRNLKCSSLKIGTEAWFLCCELWDSSWSVPDNMDQPLDICQGVTNTELSGILYPFTLGTVIYIVLYDVHSAGWCAASIDWHKFLYNVNCHCLYFVCHEYLLDAIMCTYLFVDLMSLALYVGWTAE